LISTWCAASIRILPLASSAPEAQRLQADVDRV
jgi:hypothetical protein